MGLLAAIKRTAVSFLVVFNWIHALLSRRYKIHRARFARVNELAKLMAENFNQEASLTLGISHLNHVLRVKPVKNRRELGNMLVDDNRVWPGKKLACCQKTLASSRRGNALLITRRMHTCGKPIKN